MLRFACQTRLTACRFVRITQSVHRPREPKPEPEKLVKKPEEMTLEDFCKGNLKRYLIYILTILENRAQEAEQGDDDPSPDQGDATRGYSQRQLKC